MRAIPYLFFVILFCWPNTAFAVLQLDITRGHVEPLPIAVTYFASNEASNKDLARTLTQVIEADLESSGLFISINKQAFIEQISGVDAIPHFADWRRIDTQALVTGLVKDVGGGKTRVEFRLWDILSQKQIAGRSFTASSKNWRRIAHLIADDIYERLTGEGKYFDSRIVYVAETGSWKKRVKRLAVMDQDGANHRYLTSGKTLVLTPRFDAHSQRIIYLAYYGNKPSVYIYDIETGKEDLLGRFPGMSFAPRFSPDGKKAIMSVSMDGNSEIFMIDLQTRDKIRLTYDASIDTSPSFSPDGRRIVFNSDRGGTQQIYVMDSDGNNIKRVSYGQGNYATPVWSPRGDLIAFTRIYRGKFYIGVMRPDGSGERLLTESFLDEGPTWSPNGRVIIFTRQTRSTKNKPGVTKLYSIDLTGYNERIIPTPKEASDPAWSPLLGK